MWNLWAQLPWLCDTLSADQCPSKTLLQEDVAVLSEVDDLLHHWEVEAEVALGREWGSSAAQDWAEPWSHRSSLCGQMQQMPSWVPGMWLNWGCYQRGMSCYSIMTSMVQSPGAPPSFPPLLDNLMQWAMMLRALLSPIVAILKAVQAKPQPVNLLHC